MENSEHFLIEGGVLLRYTGSEKVVTVPSGVTRIAGDAFFCDPALQKVILSDSVVQIDAFAFHVCPNLQTLCVSRSVRSVGQPITDGCAAMQRFCVDEANTVYCGIGSVLCSKDRKVLIRAPEGLDAIAYSVPDSVEQIAPYAFYRCCLLRCVWMPDSVRRIGKNAFAFCTCLEQAFLPKRSEQIGDGAFFHCAQMRAITLPETVAEIGEAAFGRCDALRTVHCLGTPQARDRLCGMTGNEALLRAVWTYLPQN